MAEKHSTNRGAAEARRARATPQTPQKLRCRVGDLVIIIANNPNFGKLGIVRRPLTSQDAALFPRDILHWHVDALGSHFSVTDGDNTREWTSDHVLAHDAELRPLRDGGGQDEMLRITGKPKKTRRAKRQEASHG